MRPTLYLSACALLLLGALGSSPSAHAQNAPVTVTYQAGWNMVGGPPGMDLSFAVALYLYGPGGYAAPTTPRTAVCQGYWAYLTAPVTVTLPGSSPTSSQACSLQAGWTMVGNPYTAPVSLPLGTLAYYWSPQDNAYKLADSIPVGASVWVYSAAASSLTLQPAQAPPPPQAGGIVINGPSPGPYQVHVGQTVTLQLTSPSYDVGVNPPNLLQLQASGQNGTGPYWTWLAVADGKAFIILAPLCLHASPPCAIPSLAIEVDILP